MKRLHACTPSGVIIPNSFRVLIHFTSPDWIDDREGEGKKERASEMLVIVRRTFRMRMRMRMTGTRSVLLTCPFPRPFCKSIKYHDKNKHRTKGGNPSRGVQRNLAWFTRFSQTDFRECPNYLSRIPRVQVDRLCPSIFLKSSSPLLRGHERLFTHV